MNVIISSVAENWVGSAPGWLTLVAVVVVGFYFVRGAGGTALSTLETANRILEGRVHELETQGRADAKLIAELKARTDIAVQIQPLVKWTGEHEHRDQERFEKTILVLGEIADRLSPNSGTGMQLPTKEAL